MRRQRVLSPIEAEFIARVQAQFNAHDPGARSEFGRRVGLSPSSVTAVLAGDQVPHIEKWAPIADYLGFSIADLFGPVLSSRKELSTVTRPVLSPQLQSGSTISPGAKQDAAIGLLREQLTVRDREIDALRHTIDVLATEFKTLAAALGPRPAARSATRSRRRR